MLIDNQIHLNSNWEPYSLNPSILRDRGPSVVKANNMYTDHTLH